MSTSKHTFDQVKSILGKLDRSIDDARAKRLDVDRPAPSSSPSLVPSAPAASPVPLAAPLAAAPADPRGDFGSPRPLRATPNYGGQSGAFGRSDRNGF